MKVALQITEKRKKGSIEIEAKYEGASPDSFVAVRHVASKWFYYRLRITDDLELLCLKFGVDYETWTRVWVRLRAKEQSNGSG